MGNTADGIDGYVPITTTVLYMYVCMHTFIG